MAARQDASGLQMRSLITGRGQLELSLVDASIQEPGEDEVLVRIEAAPINPSDIGLLLGAADITTARAGGSRDHPALICDVPAAGLRAMSGRLDQPLPAGNEGAGVVIRAGAKASHALGKRVAMIGGAMYAQYRTIRQADCMVLPDDVTSAEGASSFINPLTALGMTETMRREGHTALVHTAAASNLGQMLNRLCLKDGIGLVNIVRSGEQEKILRDQGAIQVCNSTSPRFFEDLVEALTATGATLAFDAIGGGKLAGQILTAMEIAVNRNSPAYNRYGSSVHKQVYIYGGLDIRPTEFTRGFGMAWGMGGWLLFPFLGKIGPEAAQRLKDRVIAELKTTFASHYSRTISLQQAVDPQIAAAWNRRATAEKFLIVPN